MLGAAGGLALLSGSGVGTGWAQTPAASDIRFFRIATGTTAGTYFPIGGLIANAISNPPGSRPCERGGSCGVPGLIAVAQATIGSVENIELMRAGTVEAGLAQADTAYWAFTGTGPYASKGAFTGIRSIGTLYMEAVHLVARGAAPIETAADLKGKLVSVGEEGSGTLVDARVILAAYGLTEKDIEARYLKPGTAGDRLARGELDAFFMVGGAPVGAVADVANRVPVRLVPFADPAAERLREQQRFFKDIVIPADTYTGVPETPTLGVGAELLVRADLSPDLVYGITRALWHENTRRLLADGHPRGKSIVPENAVSGNSLPLHPGAERYYRETGLIGATAEEPAAAPATPATPKSAPAPEADATPGAKPEPAEKRTEAKP